MPQYSLSTIQKIAKDETKIFYLGRTETDTRNMAYYRADIAKCIRDLKESNFYKTYHYTDSIMDAYKTTYEHPSKKGVYDDLYIKLKLTSRGEICILLGAFHLDR